ncbi:MAG: MauE/DoxX family redox-associated membrane protein [Bacteroidota bacterium]
MNIYQIIGLVFAAIALLTLVVNVIENASRKGALLSELPATQALITLSRIMVGILFFYSGFVKANDYIGFAYKLEEYFTVFGEHFSPLKGFFDIFVPLAEPMAWFISVFEIALAVAILLGWKMRLTMWLSVIMMVFFTILTAYSHVTGAVTDCGCFGDALKITPFESFMKDIILLLIIAPIFRYRNSIKAFPTQLSAGLLTGVTFLLAGIFSYYCHENLPVIDYRAYKEGVSLPVCTTEPGPDGIPKCKDWYISFMGSEKVDPFVGNVLLMIAYDMTKADEGSLLQTATLYDELEGSDIQVLGLTATGPSSLEPFQEKYRLKYPFGFMDETVLKTIIRANPGFVLLKDGIILKKWHHNNQPNIVALEKSLN